MAKFHAGQASWMSRKSLRLRFNDKKEAYLNIRETGHTKLACISEETWKNEKNEKRANTIEIVTYSDLPLNRDFAGRKSFILVPI
jgi:hypothetical protein